MKKLIVLIACALLLFACGNSSSSNAPEDIVFLGHNLSISTLPANAHNITDKGNGWITFELDGNKYLYRCWCRGHRGYAAITQIISQ